MLTQLHQPLNRIRGLLDPAKITPRNHNSVPEDLRVLDAGAEYTDQGTLDHLWFHLEGEDGQRYTKAVCLNVLTYLPRELRETMTVLEKMRKVLKGIYTARVDFLYLVANVQNPSLGVVQIYGVQAIAQERDEAVAAARQGLGAVRAAMANFEQSRLEPISLQLAEWIRQAFGGMGLALTVVGHPDPRTGPEGARGMSGGDTGQGPKPQTGLQQNEYLFRGMAAEGHEFLNVVLVSRMGDGDQADLYRLQERVAQETSIWASKEKFTRAISVGLGLPVMLSGSIGDGASSGYGTSQGHVAGRSTGQSLSRAHTEGEVQGEAWGTAHTESESWGTASTSGSSWSNTATRSETIGTADGTSHVDSTSKSTAHTSGSGSASGSNWSQSSGLTASGSVTGGGSVGASAGIPGSGINSSTDLHATVGLAATDTHSVGGFSSSSSFSSTTKATGKAQADGVNHTDSQSVTNTQSATRGGFSSHTSSHSTGVADTESYTRSEAHSTADTVASGTLTSRSLNESIGLSRAQSLSRMQVLGLGAGVAPSISFSKVYQGEDHVATLVADALRGQEAQLRTMALEGGVYVDNYFLCPTPESRVALEALIPVAFHGTEEVTTPVRPRRLTPDEEAYIRLHAMTYTPSTRPSRLPFVLEPWADTTLLTLLQAATYVAPGAFEQGLATTVQERVPPFAFFPDMPGEVVLGHQYSTEISVKEPTPVPVRLSRERMSNWAFCADTRMGKSVAAERLAFELVTQWDYRVIVADFGAGWRKLVNALPHDRMAVDLWGLSPSSPRPIRWNPLQIGRRVFPEEQMTATVELMCNAGRMGERQQGFMLQTLERLYIDHGVLTHDPAVWQHERWGWVQDEEKQMLTGAGITLPAGRVKLADLDDRTLQAIAVHRSRAVDMGMWVESLDRLLSTFRDGSPSRSAIEGVLLRLRHLTTGRMREMYGRGAGSLALEDLALPHGLCILEGGARMSQYAKAALLSLMSWHLYTDAVARREEGLEGARHAPMLLLFEEGNKIIAGVDSGASDGPRIQSDIIPSMFRDAGKYLIYLGIVVQSPAELPPGIISSCNNLAVGQLKNGEDVKVVMSGLARSPVGFVDTHYARFVNRMQRGQFILKLGLAWDVAQTEPLLFKPLMVEAQEPGAGEIGEMFRGNS
jgi:hypothetical protein